jgi:Methyltransferase domain
MAGVSMGMIDSLVQQDRRLRLAYRDVLARAAPEDGDLLARLGACLDGFCAARGLTAETVLRDYTDFLAQYLEDVRRFQETGRYPRQLPDRAPPPTRSAYDAALLLSVLVSVHRFRICRALYRLTGPLGRTAVIGAGPGVELYLVGDRASAIDVFDPALDAAIAFPHPAIRFRREPFGGEARYDTILAIELLEHLSDPYGLMARCHGALTRDGRLVTTTATNIPQFDHEFNFVDDDEFETRAQRIGYRVAQRESIVHQATFLDIGARNTFYVLAVADPSPAG